MQEQADVQSAVLISQKEPKMGLNYKHLDDRTRTLMLAEIDRDIGANKLYFSENLSTQGRETYPDLLRAAASSGSDKTLAEAVAKHLNSHEKPRKLQSGAYSKPPIMRSNAHEMLAEGEFSRFYIRALCLRAIEDGLKDLIVYRAKEVTNARAASEQKIGQAVSPEALLRDLRANPGVDTALGLPPGPNSGLCVRLA